MPENGNLVIGRICLSPAQEVGFEGDGYVFLMLLRGQAYWMGPGVNHVINGNELTIVARGSGCSLRSGRFEESELVGFSVRIKALAGVLTLDEQIHLQRWLKESELPVSLAVNHAATMVYTQLVQERLTGGLRDRARALEILAMAYSEFDEGGERVVFDDHGSNSCEARMKRFFQSLSVLEVGKLTMEQLAEVCGCTPRHAGRVFRRNFGVSLREKQNEIRMERATELLGVADAPINQIAESCGFGDAQSLVLAFRKHHGMSPREWKQKFGPVPSQTI
jgi:AraC-like DNA-binding protein